MGLLDFIRDEYGKAKKSYGLLSGIPKTFKNNPRNAETMDAVFGFGGIVPGIGDAVSAAEAKYRYDQGDMLGAGLAGLGALPMVPSFAGIIKNKKMHDAALDYFGKTTNPKETGYILDDGTRLDLSGRHMATGYEKTGPAQYRPKAGQPDYLANSRNVDHRQLVDLADKIGEDLDMYKFIDQTGAVRYMPDYGVSVLDTNMPSRAQVETFVRDFRRSGDPLSVDVDSFKTGGNVASQDFARPTVDEVYDFIQKYQKGDGPAMSTGRPRNHLGQEIPPTPYELAHAEAQRVAALPVEQGGLGLPEGNTAMDRARAMGFDTDAYHGSKSDIKEFNNKWLGSSTKANSAKQAHFAASGPENANTYADMAYRRDKQSDASDYGNMRDTRDNIKQRLENFQNRHSEQSGEENLFGESMPVYMTTYENTYNRLTNALRKATNKTANKGKEIERSVRDEAYREGWQPDELGFSSVDDMLRWSPGGGSGETIYPLKLNASGMAVNDMGGIGYRPTSYNDLLNEASKSWSTGLVIKNTADPYPGDIYASFKPELFRSRFAAFNPAKRDSADLLAGIAPWAIPIGATLLGGSFLLPPEEY